MPTREQIFSDLSIFADAGTEPQIMDGTHGFQIKIAREGEDRKYFFQVGVDRVERRDVRQKNFVDFKSLLASNEFSGLQFFSDTQKRLLNIKGINQYLEPAGVWSEANIETNPLKYDKFQELVRPRSRSNFHFVLVDGPAGVGKTSLIERLVLDRASIQGGVPILHVTSRGRRLTNLRDALAGTRDELGAKFRSREVPVLVRNGLLQVALDGFDEFVDPSGYKDAWSALKDFIRECGTSGPLILAARDTFFDQQGFEKELSTLGGGGADIAIIRLSEVSPATAKAWLEKRGWAKTELDSDATQYFLRPGSYILRPFFLSRIVELKGWSELIDSKTTPQTFLIDSMIKREAEILSKPLSAEAEMVEAALEDLFEFIAEDMAEREVDTLPTHYLAFYGEIAFQGKVPAESISRVMHSLGSIALLERGGPNDLVRFPHTEITNRFLARSLIHRLSEGTVPSFLGRIILAMDRVEAFVERMQEINLATASAVFQRIGEAKRNERQTLQFDSNITSLMLSSLSRKDIFTEKQCVSDVYANDVRALYELAESAIVNSHILRLDARNCDLSEVNFDNTDVSFLIVDSMTRLGKNIPNIDVIQEQNPAGGKTMRSDFEKQGWLRDHSAIENGHETYEYRELPMVKHFDRICRRFSAQIQIRDVAEDTGSFLLQGEEWRHIEKILTENSRLTKLFKPVGGGSRPFYKLSRPEDLLVPATEQDRAIRNRVIEEARRLAGL
jgi:hypothetical protein